MLTYQLGHYSVIVSCCFRRILIVGSVLTPQTKCWVGQYNPTCSEGVIIELIHIQNNHNHPSSDAVIVVRCLQVDVLKCYCILLTSARRQFSPSFNGEWYDIFLQSVQDKMARAVYLLTCFKLREWVKQALFHTRSLSHDGIFRIYSLLPLSDPFPQIDTSKMDSERHLIRWTASAILSWTDYIEEETIQ